MNGEPTDTNSTAVPDIRREYNPQQYIHRPQIQSAMRWLHDKNKQLLTVASPPATGKTWFLKKLREELDNNGIFKTVWIDVDDLLPPPKRPPGEITPDSKSAWFQGFFQQLAAQCPDAKRLKFQPQADISEQIEKVAKEMCRHCFLGQQVVLFIDNGDIVSDSSWRLFERTILEPFAREELLRLVIALREDQKVQFPLTWRQQRLLLGDLAADGDPQPHPGDEHIQTLSQEFPTLLPQVLQLLEAVPTYNKTHPGINTFLFLYAEKYPNPQPSVEFMRIMLESLNPFSPHDTGELIDILRYVADYADEWVIEELAAWQNVSNTEAWQRAQKLIDNFLVVNIAYNRYKVADGVREFARTALKLQTTVTVETTPDVSAEQTEQRLLQQLATMMPVHSENVLNVVTTPDRIRIALDLPTELANQLVTLYLQKQLVFSDVNVIDVKYEPIKLRTLIEKHFDLAEIKTLCFDLDIKYQNLSGDTLTEKVIELVKYCERHGRMSDLLLALQQARPKVSWQP
ncbi:MAG: hypothetical protein KF770_18875 [Anaerolineae bacterium]|nr:hypothetical protein [Anaerolineae bacterium]